MTQKRPKVLCLATIFLCLLLAGCGSSGPQEQVLPPPLPNITSLSPTSGVVGTLVTITGRNFGSVQNSSMVTFGGTLAGPVSWSVNSIVVTVPSAAPTGDVVVTVAEVASNGMPFTVLANGLRIPASFWGLIINKESSYPLLVPYGQFRGWDSGGGQWPNLETCQASSASPGDPCFDWSKFDTQMADLYAAGVTDVMYTLSRTPLWAVSLASEPTGLMGTDCNYYIAGSSESGQTPGQCIPPIDLNPDGSGADLIWQDWVGAIAARVNDPTYLQTHAHIKYWEPWNEWYRSSVVLPNYVAGNGESFQGTYAQMVRLTEDLRCVITGTGTIHNFPAAGDSTPCSATAIDPQAVIVAPAGAAGTQGPLDVTQNFLYCNGTGTHAPVTGSNCTTGSAGSQAVDIINFHLPAGTVTPETVAATYIPNARAILQAADLSKPMINGEGSWNIPTNSGNLWSDPHAQAGFIPRFFALYWSAGLTLNMWYSYDTDDGELYDVSTGSLNEPAAMAWTLTYNLLVGAAPTNSPFCSNQGTVYTCDLTEASGRGAELVWDAQYGQDCSQMANPTICGATQYTVPTQFNKDWIDVTGTVHPATSTVAVGANPIVLEAQ